MLNRFVQNLRRRTTGKCHMWPELGVVASEQRETQRQLSEGFGDDRNQVALQRAKEVLDATALSQAARPAAFRGGTMNV